MGHELSSAEVSEALKIKRSALAVWRKQGLPARKRGRVYVYDEDEVYQWLLDSKKYVDEEVAPPDYPVFTTRKEVAVYFGGSTRTVASWLEDPTFPGSVGQSGQNPKGHFPAKEIAEWLIKTGKKATIPPELLEEFEDEHVTYRLTHQDRLIGARADKAELERDRMLGSMLDADQYYREVLRQHNAVVTVLRSLPAKIVNLLPTELDESVKTAIYKVTEQTVSDAREQVQALIEGDEDDKEHTKK